MAAVGSVGVARTSACCSDRFCEAVDADLIRPAVHSVGRVPMNGSPLRCFEVAISRSVVNPFTSQSWSAAGRYSVRLDFNRQQSVVISDVQTYGICANGSLALTSNLC